MDFMTMAKERYSVRDYKEEQIAPELLNKVLEADMYAPTAKNRQPQRIYVVQSEEKLAKLREMAPCTYGAPTVLLFGYKKDEEWKNPREEGAHTGDQDISIVATHVMFEAWELGLGTCWCNIFVNSEVAKAMDVPDDVRLVLYMPIGYPIENAPALQLHYDSKNIEDVVSYL